MAMLHIIGHQIDDGDVIRVGESAALLVERIKVGVGGADYILTVRLDQAHTWLEDREGGQIGAVVDVGVAVHELEIAF